MREIGQLRELATKKVKQTKKMSEDRRKVKILDASEALLTEPEETPAFVERDKPGWYGQLIIGPPGCGKSTYCKIMAEFLRQIGRKAAIVNLDPANDVLQYDATIDVFELINLDDVMEHLKL